MAILDPAIHARWLRQAKEGNPPDPVDVARLQYALDTPWHVRTRFLPILRGIQKGGAIRRYKRLVTRGGGKSVTDAFLTCYAAEYIIPFLDVRSENKRILIIGRRQDHVIDQNMKAIHQMVCEFAPWLKTADQSLWNDPGMLEGKRYTSWSKTRFDLLNGISIRAYGIDQSVRGEHVFLAIIDDTVDDRNFTLARHQHNIITAAIEFAVEQGGAIVVTGTPQTGDDLYSMLKEEDGWDCDTLPAWDDKRELDYEKMNRIDVEAGYQDASVFQHPEDWHCLWPTRFSYEAVMATRGTTRSSIHKWLRERQLNPVADDTLLVHPNDMAAAKDPSIVYAKSVKTGCTYAGLDPSTLKEDETAIVVVSLDEKGRRRVLHMEAIPKAKRDATEEENLRLIFDRIRSVHERFRPRWLVEANGWQSMIKPLAQSEIPGILMDTLMLTGNKHQQDGWPMIRNVFEAGDIVLPYGQAPHEEGIPEADWDSHKKTDNLIDQLKGLRYIDGKIVEDSRVKNDLASALFLALRASEEAVGEHRISVVDISGKKREERYRQPTKELPHTMPDNKGTLQKAMSGIYLNRRRGGW